MLTYPPPYNIDLPPQASCSAEEQQLKGYQLRRAWNVSYPIYMMRFRQIRPFPTGGKFTHDFGRNRICALA
jgi:hypothetical protein